MERCARACARVHERTSAHHNTAGVYLLVIMTFGILNNISECDWENNKKIWKKNVYILRQQPQWAITLVLSRPTQTHTHMAFITITAKEKEHNHKKKSLIGPSFVCTRFSPNHNSTNEWRRRMFDSREFAMDTRAHGFGASPLAMHTASLVRACHKVVCGRFECVCVHQMRTKMVKNNKLDERRSSMFTLPHLFYLAVFFLVLKWVRVSIWFWRIQFLL